MRIPAEIGKKNEALLQLGHLFFLFYFVVFGNRISLGEIAVNRHDLLAGLCVLEVPSHKLLWQQGTEGRRENKSCSSQGNDSKG